MKTSLHKISPTSTFPTWWELAPPSCLHSHITLGPSPLLRRPNKFGQPTRGSVGIRSYIFLRKLANNYTNMTISKSNKTYEPTCFLCLSNRHAGMIFLVPRIPPRIMVHHNHLLSHAYYVIPFQLLEYQWRESRFDTLGKLASAHPGGGQHPPGGWVPSGGWLRCAGGVVALPQGEQRPITPQSQTNCQRTRDLSVYDWGNLNVETMYLWKKYINCIYPPPSTKQNLNRYSSTEKWSRRVFCITAIGYY